MSKGVDSVTAKLNRWLEDEEEDSSAQQTIEEFVRDESAPSSIVDPINFFFPTSTLGKERAVPTGVQPTQGRAENTGFFGSLAQTKTGQALAQPIEQINQATSAKAVKESPIGSILETINAGVGAIFSPFSALEAFVSEQPDSPQKFLTEGLVKVAFALPKLGGFLGREVAEEARDVGAFLGGKLAKVAKDNLSEEQIKKLGGLAPDPKNLNRILEGLISTAETEGAFLGGAGLPKVLGKGAKAFKELPKTTRRDRVEPVTEPIIDPRRGRVEEPVKSVEAEQLELGLKTETPESASLQSAKVQMDSILKERSGDTIHNQQGALSQVNYDAFQKLQEGKKGKEGGITKQEYDAILDMTRKKTVELEALKKKTTPDPDIKQKSGDNVEPPGVTKNVTGKEIKTRGLSLSTEAHAIEKGLTKGFENLPEYGVEPNDPQIKVASELATKDFNQAKKIAMGDAPPPIYTKDGKSYQVLPEIVYRSVELAALRKGDMATIRDLATSSKLVPEATFMGQRLQALRNQDPLSPVKGIRDIIKTREGRFGKKLPELKESVHREIKTEIKKNSPKIGEWETFIKRIQCR